MWRAQSNGINTAEGLLETNRWFHRYARIETVVTLDSVLPRVGGRRDAWHLLDKKRVLTDASASPTEGQARLACGSGEHRWLLQRIIDFKLVCVCASPPGLSHQQPSS